jgi:hypothetical protein
MLDKCMTFVEAVGYLRGIVTLKAPAKGSMELQTGKPGRPCKDKDPPRGTRP